jgi:hypothetical protein
MDDQKHRRITGILILILILGFCSSTYADKIYLKDGKVYEGKLLGKSQKRFLFSVEVEGETFQMSFFPGDVQKIELGKNTVEEQIPYLKEVESTKISVQEGQPKTYEMSLYKEGPKEAQIPAFSDKEVRSVLNKEEAEYYQHFNEILNKYIDKFSAIQNILMNLTTATREDFAGAKQYMDELYFELNNLFVPAAFKKSHMSYLESVKANFLVFQALEQGALDEAAKQIKIVEDSKLRAVNAIKELFKSRHENQPPKK